jgi:hypothetical protein
MYFVRITSAMKSKNALQAFLDEKTLSVSSSIQVILPFIFVIVRR